MIQFFVQKDLDSSDDLYKDFRLKQKNSLYSWVFFSVFVVFCVCTIGGIFLFYNSKRNFFLKNQSLFLSKKVEQLEQGVKDLSCFESMNCKLKAKQVSFFENKKSINSFLKMLHAVTVSIPDSTWLDKIVLNLEEKKKNKAAGKRQKLKKYKIEAIGHTFDAQEIILFNEKMKKSGTVRSFELKKFQKENDVEQNGRHVKGKSDLYSFHLVGFLKS